MLPNELTEYEKKLSDMKKYELEAELEKQKSKLDKIDSSRSIVDQYQYDYISDQIFVIERLLSQIRNSRRESWFKKRANL